MSRRTTGLVAVGVVLVLVAVALIGLGTGVVRFGSTGTPGVPRFTEEAAAAGIDHRYDGDQPFAVGGGVAAFDCDGDGRPELFLAGGAGPAALYRNASAIQGPLRFTALHAPVTDVTGVTGAYPLDIDGDGKVDLAVLRLGGVDLLRGLGDCRFERANERWSFDGGRNFSTAFSATW